MNITKAVDLHMATATKGNVQKQTDRGLQI